MTRLIDADSIPWFVEGVGEIPVITKQEIDEMPVVDAVPVRHGKWMLYYDIEQGRALRCSECKMVFWVGDGREGNFCPNCGAKMDVETNERSCM